MFQIKVSFLPCLPSDPPIFIFKFGVKDLTERQVHILLVILAEITVQFTWDWCCAEEWSRKIQQCENISYIFGKTHHIHHFLGCAVHNRVRKILQPHPLYVCVVYPLQPTHYWTDAVPRCKTFTCTTFLHCTAFIKTRILKE